MYGFSAVTVTVSLTNTSHRASYESPLKNEVIFQTNDSYAKPSHTKERQWKNVGGLTPLLLCSCHTSQKLRRKNVPTV